MDVRDGCRETWPDLRDLRHAVKTKGLLVDLGLHLRNDPGAGNRQPISFRHQPVRAEERHGHVPQRAFFIHRERFAGMTAVDNASRRVVADSRQRPVAGRAGDLQSPAALRDGMFILRSPRTQKTEGCNGSSPRG